MALNDTSRDVEVTPDTDDPATEVVARVLLDQGLGFPGEHLGLDHIEARLIAREITAALRAERLL